MAITHDIHDGRGGRKTVTTTPIRAIRLFCVECMGYQVNEVRRCTAPLCPLYPYRLGEAHTGNPGADRETLMRIRERRSLTKKP